LFSLLLGLGGPGEAIRAARLVVVGAGGGVLLAHAVLSPGRDPRQLDRVSVLAGPVVALLTAVVAYFLGHTELERALTTAGALVAAAALLPLLVHRTTTPVDLARQALSEDLAVRARRLNGQLTEYCAAEELRPGEEVLVQAGEVVPADGTVVAGTAQVLPWRGCPQQESRAEGDPVVAGAQILDGALRVVTGWTGSDRAWLRLVTDRRRRADLHSFIARVAHGIAQRGSLAAAALVLLAGFALGADSLTTVLAGAAAHAAFAHAGVAELAATRMARACLEALGHGIAFHAAEHLDTTGSVTIAALCARGTVLLGEPEVTGIEPLEQLTPEELLALAAGAESAVYHPVATAVLRATRARGIRPDATRNHNPVPGLGVTAVTSNGRGLVVGSRALMLREKISVARAEQRITELESLGRSALLVAVDGHLCGILALQDGLRSGARAAVQHLLDLGVEPVLLSGDSRETTDAIARSIDIEHVRPELPAAQRGDEVRQLSEGGAIVAVVGRSPVDDIALGAADVSVALRAAAASNADFSIGLASDDVREAARAIRIARKARDGARTVLALSVVPATLACLAIAFGLVSPAAAPASALLGTLAALLLSRED
jgi:cation transport ATPase